MLTINPQKISAVSHSVLQLQVAFPASVFFSVEATYSSRGVVNPDFVSRDKAKQRGCGNTGPERQKL